MESAQPSRPDQRLNRKYRFGDPDMDLFWVAALGWGPAGGLDAGEAYYVADRITDGDPDSWVNAFAAAGDRLHHEADQWAHEGHRQSAGEARLKTFAAYRSAWQFAGPGPRFEELYTLHRQAFRWALKELGIPCSCFGADYPKHDLPGVWLPSPFEHAPTVIIVGGADTCLEDLFLTAGRYLWDRGYSVALVDLPGQGDLARHGLHWEAEAERPIARILDTLITCYGVNAQRLALLGLSLGGYFATRAAGYEPRLATVMASTPFPNPAELFAQSVQSAQTARAAAPPSPAALRSRQMLMWKAGADNAEAFVERTRGFVADPKRVHMPFLSILGTGDSPLFVGQAKAWHEALQSKHKRLVLLDAPSGADGHVQVANRRRLVQECANWLEDLWGPPKPIIDAATDPECLGWTGVLGSP